MRQNYGGLIGSIPTVGGGGKFRRGMRRMMNQAANGKQFGPRTQRFMRRNPTFNMYRQQLGGMFPGIAPQQPPMATTQPFIPPMRGGSFGATGMPQQGGFVPPAPQQPPMATTQPISGGFVPPQQGGTPMPQYGQQAAQAMAGRMAQRRGRRAY